MYAPAMTWSERESLLWRAPELLLRPLHLALTFPSLLYLTVLIVFLFKPPDLDLYHADRIAFGALCFFATLRVLALREKLRFAAGLSLPMLGLTVLAMLRAVREPFDAQTWSLVAAKFVVPFVMFHLAMLVFGGAPQQSQFQWFLIATLAYLIFTALAFLIGARGLIFPAFILDPSIGLHADRARGPFLQAVANGVSLNLLGLLAATVSGTVRRRLALVLWIALPWAVLATMTRSVWISFVVAGIALGIRIGRWPVRKVCLWIVAASLLIGLFAGLATPSQRRAISERTEERGPVDARVAVYQAGWSMILERPLTGWSPRIMYRELARRMPGYQLHTFFIHNTYLALLLEFGWPGLALYALLFFNLFRLSKARSASEPHFIRTLRKTWPLLLCVFLFNALFVDMAYQFVIGLLFTVAGLLCAPSKAKTA